MVLLYQKKIDIWCYKADAYCYLMLRIMMTENLQNKVYDTGYLARLTF